MEAQYWRDLDATPIDSAAESSDDDDESDADATPSSRRGDVRTRNPGGAGAQTDADSGAASNWWWCSIL